MTAEHDDSMVVISIDYRGSRISMSSVQHDEKSRPYTKSDEKVR